MWIWWFIVVLSTNSLTCFCAPACRCHTAEIRPPTGIRKTRGRRGTVPRSIHPQNLTYPLKNDGWKMSFLLRLPIFRGYVKFPGCKSQNFHELLEHTPGPQPTVYVPDFLSFGGFRDSWGMLQGYVGVFLESGILLSSWCPGVQNHQQWKVDPFNRRCMVLWLKMGKLPAS